MPSIIRPVGKRRAGCGGERREDIDELDGHGQALAGRDPRRPADEEGRSDAAFEEGALPSPIGLVDFAEARIPSAAVVVGEDDDCVLVDPFALSAAITFPTPRSSARIIAP